MTRRVYLAGAKAVLQAAAARSDRTGGDAGGGFEARAGGLALPVGLRTRPFLRFLEARQGHEPAEDPEPPCRRVLDALDRANRFRPNPSLAARRDAALLAAWCAAPDRGDPRAWPQACLALRETRLLLWGGEVTHPALGLALRHWLQWRERLGRPDQRRLYRKSPGWDRSGLLFPGPHGAPLSRSALHNALRRLLAGSGEGVFSLTPETIRAAFRAANRTA